MKDHYITEATLSQLQQDTESGFPDTKRREHIVNTVKIKNVHIQVYENGSMEVKAKAASQSGQTYQPKIIFDKVEPGDIPVMSSSRKISTISPIDKNEVDVQVSCNCMDFYWRFSMWNSTEDSLIGPPPAPYVKKTDRPPVNPTRSPGMCKHLWALVDHLEKKNILR